jgi:hypothetical protein
MTPQLARRIRAYAVCLILCLGFWYAVAWLLVGSVT